MEGHSSLRTLQRLEIEKCTPSSTNLVTNVKSRILAISFFPYYTITDAKLSFLLRWTILIFMEHNLK